MQGNQIECEDLEMIDTSTTPAGQQENINQDK
jgi:hypothetical protein